MNIELTDIKREDRRALCVALLTVAVAAAFLVLIV